MALSFPSSPTPDQIYTVGDQSWKWNGTSWEALASAEVAPPVYINSLPPTAPQSGYLWWNSNTGELYVYYEGAWVAANIPPVASSLDSDAVVDAFVSELTEYADQAAAIAGGIPTGGMYKVSGSGIASIRVVV